MRAPRAVGCCVAHALFLALGQALHTQVNPAGAVFWPFPFRVDPLPAWLAAQRAEWARHLRTPAKQPPTPAQQAPGGTAADFAVLGPDTSRVNVNRKCRPEPVLQQFFRNLDAGGGLDLALLNQTFAADPHLVKILIRGNRIPGSYLKPSMTLAVTQQRMKPILDLIEMVLAEVQLPDMDIVFSMIDQPVGPPGTFKFWGKVETDLLFVPYELSDLGREHRRQQQTFEHFPPCRERIPKAVFRGSTSGLPGAAIRYEDIRAGKYPPSYRFEVARLSTLRPDLLDAGFTRVVQANGDEKKVEELLQKRGMMRGWLNDYEQSCYSAVVVVDGNGPAVRLSRQLLYGTPVVLMHEKEDEFWYADLEAGVDFVHATPQTLVHTLEFLRSQANFSAQVGRNGKKYASTYLNEDRLMCYARAALQEYGVRWRQAQEKPPAPGGPSGVPRMMSSPAGTSGVPQMMPSSPAGVSSPVGMWGPVAAAGMSSSWPAR